jgi:glutamate/tyrosine decarboxylase-like PLP-dependent enzyme
MYQIQIISNSVESFFIVSAGGSVSNMYGMVLARYRAIPDSKTKGLSGLPPLVVFTSEDVSHDHCSSAHNLTASSSFFI